LLVGGSDRTQRSGIRVKKLCGVTDGEKGDGRVEHAEWKKVLQSGRERWASCPNAPHTGGGKRVHGGNKLAQNVTFASNGRKAFEDSPTRGGVPSFQGE